MRARRALRAWRSRALGADRISATEHLVGRGLAAAAQLGPDLFELLRRRSLELQVLVGRAHALEARRLPTSAHHPLRGGGHPHRCAAPDAAGGSRSRCGDRCLVHSKAADDKRLGHVSTVRAEPLERGGCAKLRWRSRWRWSCPSVRALRRGRPCGDLDERLGGALRDPRVAPVGPSCAASRGRGSAERLGEPGRHGASVGGALAPFASGGLSDRTRASARATGPWSSLWCSSGRLLHLVPGDLSRFRFRRGTARPR